MTAKYANKQRRREEVDFLRMEREANCWYARFDKTAPLCSEMGLPALGQRKKKQLLFLASLLQLFCIIVCFCIIAKRKADRNCRRTQLGAQIKMASPLNLVSVRQLAAQNNLIEIYFNPESRVISFRDQENSFHVNVYYTSGTVGTCVNHPVNCFDGM